MAGIKGAELSQYVEELLETVLNGTTPRGSDGRLVLRLAQEVINLECKSVRVVAFGGGTGLSTVIGGNSQLEDWPEQPFVGLKEEFSALDVVVCTTDDGGSTGLLLQQLPLIGIGDLRKLLLSMILRENLRSTYGLNDFATIQLVRVIHSIFNHRFGPDVNDSRCISKPALVVPDNIRACCPEALYEFLSMLGRHVSPGGEGPTIRPGGHCLGNLLLTAAILRESRDGADSPPDSAAIERGLDIIARAIGATPGRLHPATSTPGQLVLRYGNGVAVRGQRKSAQCRRNFPVDRVAVEYCGHPGVKPDLCRAIEEADLIIYAPGSVYTSLLPMLKLPPIINAIKANRKALKILGANFWIQEGETDISRRSRNRGFYVSELVEAYEQNVPGGAEGLFDVILSANLEHVPGNVLCNYALEGKSPIYLDRSRVEQLKALPIEATIYSTRRMRLAQVIHHDPQRFALAVRTLVFAHQRFNLKPDNTPQPCILSPPIETPSLTFPPLCEYRKTVGKTLETKHFSPAWLRNTILDITWDNRDIRTGHLRFFRGAEIVGARAWNRSKEWDNVLGYYDPENQMLKLHEHLSDDPERMRENLVIALGESLLGNYLECRRWIGFEKGEWGARCYEIRLRPEKERGCFLSGSELHTYLTLSRMIRSPGDPRTYRITLNDNEGFLPPGLLFGLTYAWYLNNAYGSIMEYEMSLLRWPHNKLIPHQIEEQKRKQALIVFFRNVVFRHSN
ncbi:MAG: YvcK family protein [Desulfobacteraceae bacterium]|nr:YvcK family protein [Desulfobacteraceae bacterium]